MTNTAKLTALTLACIMISWMTINANANTNPVNLNLTETISIEKNSEISIPIIIENTENTSQQIELATNSSQPELTAFLPIKQLTLNKTEKTTISITINATQNTPSGNHSITITARTQNNSVQKTLNVLVHQPQNIDLFFQEQNRKICTNNGSSFQNQITIQNKSNQKQEITIFSNSQEFIATFANQKIETEPNSSKNIPITINFNQTHNTGKKEIEIIAKNSHNETVQKKLFFEFDCPEQDAFFELTLNTQTTRLEKGQEKNIQITLKNKLNEKQKIFLSSESDLKTSKLFYENELEPLEEKNFSFTIFSEKGDLSGEHEIKFFAWNQNNAREKTLKLELRKDTNLQINVLNNDLNQRICSAQDFEIFEVEIKNNEHTQEKLSLKILNEHKTIGTSISSEKFELSPFEKKTIKITVQPAFDTPTGKKEIILEIRSLITGKKLQETLSFTVIEPKTTGIEELEIISPAIILNAFAGEKKTINILVKNKSNSSLNNIQVRIIGLDKQTSFSTQTIESLKPHETGLARISMQVKPDAIKKDYELTIEARKDTIKTTQKLQLSIIGQKIQQGIQTENDDKDLLTGLTVFLQELPKKPVFSLILLIVACAIIVILSLTGSNIRQKKPVWAAKKTF